MQSEDENVKSEEGKDAQGEDVKYAQGAKDVKDESSANQEADKPKPQKQFLA